jgi:hypothetical protein
MQILPGSVYRLAHRFLIFNLVKKMYLKKSEDKKTLAHSVAHTIFYTSTSHADGPNLL